jgi:hypothetical protein
MTRIPSDGYAAGAGVRGLEQSGAR